MDHNTATEDMIFVEEAGVNANIILAGVNINVGTTWNDYDDCALRIADNSTGDVTITIQDGTTNTLTSYGSCAGIQKTGDANTGTLTIRGDGKDSGVLNATGGEYGAGIGGSSSDSSYVENIAIYNSSVKAVGEEGMPAIGWGTSFAGGTPNPVTPTASLEDGAANVYLFEMNETSGKTITINGVTYPDNHMGESKLYVYLPAAPANEVTIDGVTTKYCYDTTKQKWVTVIDIPEEPEETTFYYGPGWINVYALAENDAYTIEGNKKINAGSYKVIVRLKDKENTVWSDGTTEDKEYDFVINRAPVTYVQPTKAANEITYGQSLASVGLTVGGWYWANSEEIPVVNNNGYVVEKDVDDTNKDYSGIEGYDAEAHKIRRTIAVTVNKATPYMMTAPTAVAITYGKTLKDSALSGGTVQYSETEETVVAGTWSWKEETTKPVVADSETIQYEVVFTPTDAENYNVIETKITLTVNKSETTPNMPESTMNVLYSQKTVGDVKLPEGWVWNEADKATALPLEEAVRVTATYNGADKGNYVTESIEITLIRKDCAHEESDIRYTGEGEKAPTCTETGIGHTECTKCQEPMQTNVTVEATGHIGETEVKDAKAATCAEEGYTGDTYCKDCGAKIVTGTKMDKSTAHTWDNGVVTKEATATEKGEKTYTCSVCKTTKKEEIPALGAPEVGTTNTSDDGKATYKVTTSNLTNGTVTYVAPTNKKATTVAIPDTAVMDGVTYKVTSVEKKAFKNNKKIKKVTIGKNVSKIGSKAFYGCSKLKTLTIKSSKLTTKKIGSKAFSKTPKSMTVKVPKKKFKTYKSMLIKRGVNKKAKFKKS